MKRTAGIILFAVLFALTGSASGQSVGNYAPAIRTTGITYTSIATTGNSFAGWRNGDDPDDNRSNPAPIGFTFYYDGQTVTQFSVSTNGFLDFSSSTATGISGSAYGNQNESFSATNGTLLAVAPFYDDLSTPNYDPLDDHFKYRTTGSPGNRVLTVEWINLQPWDTPGPDLNFQVKLYEATRAIEIIYGTMNGELYPFGYTVGINGPTMSTVPLASELLTQQTVDTTNFSNAPQNNLATPPTGNTRLTFLPAQTATPSAPVNVTFSSITPIGMTVGWTDNSTTETYFTVSRSTDNATFSPAGSVISTTIGGTGTTYSLAQTELLPQQTYYFRITANNEASAPSPFLTGNQTTITPNEIASVATGNWGDTTTWSTGTIPTAADNVTISDNHAVTINVAASCYRLTVGQGASGTLQYEHVTARTLTAGRDITIAEGATLQTAASGSVLTDSLVVGDNLINNGTLDLSTNAGTVGARIVFNRPGSAIFAGTGATTDLYKLTINKGTSSADMVALSPSNLTIQGTATDGPASAFLTLVNGTLRIAGTFTGSHRCFTVPNYSIPATAGFWLDNPNFTVAGQNASPINRGLLRISQGTFNAGTSADNNLGGSTGAVFRIEGGTLNVGGRMQISSAVTYNQSGGTVNVATAGVGSNSRAFDLNNQSTSFTMSGGSIVLMQAGAPVYSVDYRVASSGPSITGGTLQIGTGATIGSFNFRIAGAMPSLVIDNTTNAKTATVASYSTAVVYGNTVIMPSSVLDLNGYAFVQRGAALINDGTLNGSVVGSQLFFRDSGADGNRVPPAGSPPIAVAQTLSGGGTITSPLDWLVIDNPAGVTIDPAFAAGSIVTRRVDLLRGTLFNADRLMLGIGTGNVVTQIGAINQTSPGGSFDSSPSFNIGTGDYSILYQQESTARITGYEIPSSRTVSSVTIDNTNNVTLAGGHLLLSSGLTLAAGLLNTSAGNVLTLSSSVASPPAGSATKYVNGPLAIEINSAAPTNRTFAIGKAGAFRPVVLKQVNTGGVPRVYTAEVIAGPSGGTPLIPLEQLDGARYWTIGNTATLNSTARVNLSFGADDHVPVITYARLAQAAAANGNYASLGGLATGSPTSGTVESTMDLTPGNDFFSIGLQGAPLTWIGSGGNNNWSNPLNWSSNSVPAPGQNVDLLPSFAATIEVDGSFACNNLVVGTNANLRIMAANTLTLNGSYTQSGGTINLGTGTLEVKGAFARTGGTFTADTGTTVFSGASTQTIGGGVTHNNLIFRNGGSAGRKVLTAGGTSGVFGDLTVESTAQLALSTSTATGMTISGNLYYSGLPGGPNISSLSFNLVGSGKVIGGASAKASPAVTMPDPDKIPLVEIDFLTDPATAKLSGELLEGGKLAIVFENTYEKRWADVEKLLATIDPEARLMINCDDMTIVRNPASFSKLLVSPSVFDMTVNVGSAGIYTLADNITVGPGKVLTVSGRLNCATFTIGGAGAIAVTSGINPRGTLGIATAAGGVGTTVYTTGPNSFANGSNIDYYAAGVQTIHAASHPASAMLYTSGSGTKTLDGNKTISGNSGVSLGKGALVVGAGTTFADGGFTLSFSGSYANVLINGTYASAAGGAMSYEVLPYDSNISAADGTSFGDLKMNFASSTSSIHMNATGTTHVSFRNIVCGGTAGTGTAGGTLRLNDSGTTIMTVTGDVNIMPSDVTWTGGGFTGVGSSVGTVTIRGNVTTTSTNPNQPIMGNIGTNTLVMGGTGPQTFTVGATTDMFTGATLKIDNPAGVTLGGATERTYGIAGTLNLTNGNITTGANTLAMRTTGSLVRTSGHVAGKLSKYFSSAALARTFEIGSGVAYAPVSIAFASVATPGDLTATTVPGDHPEIATSGLAASRSVNRYYTLTNAGVAFTTAGATLTWDPTDMDPGCNPDQFIAAKYDATAWSMPTLGAHSATSMEVTGLTSFSDFAVGTRAGISIDDVALSEGESGTQLASFTVTLGGSSTQVVTVDYATADGTATAAGGDYVAVLPARTLTFNPGDPLTQVVTIAVNGDRMFELNETFFVNLSNAVNVPIEDGQGLGTIQNDDAEPTLSIDDIAILEGAATPKLRSQAAFTVSMSNPSYQAVTVDFATSDGTATLGDLDYVPIAPPQMITFSPGGPPTQTVSVTVIEDGLVEPDETLFLNLSNPQHATLTDAQGQATILNDDAPIQVPPPGQGQTIQQAIYSTPPAGGTIQVAPGSYAESLILDRRIQLIGSGRGTTVINSQSPGITVTTSASLIASLTLAGTGTDPGILVDHSAGTVNTLTVTDVEIRNFECGVCFEDTAAPIDGGSGHLIENCDIHDILLGNPLYRGAGINGGTTSGLQVHGSRIHDTRGPGIHLTAAAGAVLANASDRTNHFYRNAGLALVLDGNPAAVAAGYNYWGHPDPEAVIHHRVDDPPEGLVNFANAVAPTVAVAPVMQRRSHMTVFTADVTIDMRGVPQTVRGYDVQVTWDPTLLNFVSAARGTFLTAGGGSGGTSFLHFGTDGSRTISEAILGAAPGASGTGTLFTITFTTETTNGVSPLDLPLSITLRDMANPASNLPNTTADGSVEIDGTPPANVTAFNATVGHNKISLSWVDPTDADFLAGGGVEIWRAGWDRIAGPPTQSAYPEYDDWATDELPVIPATRAAAASDPDWSLVTTAAPGAATYIDASFTDADRNVYFYAAFTRDDLANYAATVAGATHDRAASYYLGDFTRGPGDPLFGPPYGAAGAGSVVDFNDVVSLSSLYGAREGDAPYNPQADIGPSDDGGPFGIPTTDSAVNFEDLMLFAINFAQVFALTPPSTPVPAEATASIVVHVDAPPSRLPAGAVWTVAIRTDAAGQAFQGLSIELAYDPAVLALEATAAGGLWSANPPGFCGFVHSAGGVNIDGAFMGSEAARSGEVATLVFRMRVAGTPTIDVARLDARNARNHPLPIEIGEVPVAGIEPAAVVPLAFALAQNEPNPFNPSTAIRFDLAADAYVKLAIFDVRGRLVRMLVDQARPAGSYTVVWDGRDSKGQTAASGVYILHMDAGAFHTERKMTLIR